VVVHGQTALGRLTTIGFGVLHDDPSKRMHFRRIDLHMRQIGENVNEIAGSCLRDEFTIATPTHLAGAMAHECNRLLTAMMANSRLRTGLDLENATPDRGANSKLRRDGGTFCSRP
jgi:hypothetical protein